MKTLQIIDVCDPFPGSCSNTKAYIADVTGFALIVYDSMTDSSWRVRNSKMKNFQLIMLKSLKPFFLNLFRELRNFKRKPFSED